MPLIEFINDFDLKSPNGIIAFSARIEYYIREQNGKAEAEVQVVNIRGAETVYILSNNEVLQKLPGYFNEAESIITYIPQFCLHIHEKDGEERYNILIFPDKVIYHIS